PANATSARRSGPSSLGHELWERSSHEHVHDLHVEQVPDAFGGQYPGQIRFLTEELKARQVAITHRLMPPRSGGKGSYGHRHKTQEEIYYVISGTLQFKLDDKVIEVHGGTAVWVAPVVARS